MPLDDPNAAVWSSAPQAQFPMSPQVHWQNRIQEVTVKDLKVRALNDGKQVAVLLEYATRPKIRPTPPHSSSWSATRRRILPMGSRWPRSKAGR